MKISRSIAKAFEKSTDGRYKFLCYAQSLYAEIFRTNLKELSQIPSNSMFAQLNPNIINYSESYKNPLDYRTNNNNERLNHFKENSKIYDLNLMEKQKLIHLADKYC
jgi:hypothetical protein